jgi:hypothetical protein
LSYGFFNQTLTGCSLGLKQGLINYQHENNRRKENA